MNGGATSSGGGKTEVRPSMTEDCGAPEISAIPEQSGPEGSTRLVRRSKRPRKEEKQKVKSKEVTVTPLEQNTLQMRGYRLSYKLGEGSYAHVYRTDYTAVVNGKPVSQVLACKIIDAAKAPKDFVKKFLPRELEILNKINHPHLIHVHSIFQCKKKFFIFMRYAEEGDLLDYVLRRDIGENQARVWFRQLALAAQYLHTLDIVHRDIKCENVLITRNMNVKLADFGFSRFMDSKTFSCTYCGSLAYASPEILRGQPYCPKAADVWSLGVLLYVILNQSMPFSDANVKKSHQQQMSGQWNFRAKIAKVVSEEVKNLVKAMLKADRTKRLNINQVVDSEWIKMNPRLIPLNNQERESLQKAIASQRNDKGIKTQQLIKYQLDNRKKFAPILVMTPSKIGLSSKFYRYSETAHVSHAKSSNVVQERAAVVIQAENDGDLKVSLTNFYAAENLKSHNDPKISPQNQTRPCQGTKYESAGLKNPHGSQNQEEKSQVALDPQNDHKKSQNVSSKIHLNSMRFHQSQTSPSFGQNDDTLNPEILPKNLGTQSQLQKSQGVFEDPDKNFEKSSDSSSKVCLDPMRFLILRSDCKELASKSEAHKIYHQSTVPQFLSPQITLQKQQKHPLAPHEERLKSQILRLTSKERCMKPQNFSLALHEQRSQKEQLIRTEHQKTAEHLTASLALSSNARCPLLVVPTHKSTPQEQPQRAPLLKSNLIGSQEVVVEKSQKTEAKDQGRKSDPQVLKTIQSEQSVFLTQLLKSQNLQSFPSLSSQLDNGRSDFLNIDVKAKSSSNFENCSTSSRKTQPVLSDPRSESKNPSRDPIQNPENNTLDQIKIPDQNFSHPDKSTFLITPFSRLSQLGKAFELQLLPDLSLSRTLLVSNILDPLKQDSKCPSLTEIKALDKSLDFQSNPTLNMIS